MLSTLILVFSIFSHFYSSGLEGCSSIYLHNISTSLSSPILSYLLSHFLFQLLLQTQTHANARRISESINKTWSYFSASCAIWLVNITKSFHKYSFTKNYLYFHWIMWIWNQIIKWRFILKYTHLAIIIRYIDWLISNVPSKFSIYLLILSFLRFKIFRVKYYKSIYSKFKAFTIPKGLSPSFAKNTWE